ncbi:MAG TPA: tRNA glutamyl-Q(34) synthetase GluQRS [Methylophilaceae bacterium]|nr:tRNA glutamyl-Q(34) synthetase GluQRS [Methylophilaceae bacterium]
MYIGRFAPSPTGPLHFGSLVTAVASYLDARSKQGKWLLRMEDLDKQREVKGAASNIFSTLKTYGFYWDDAVIYQSQRKDIYERALAKLKVMQHIYPCTCTRKEIADSSEQTGIEGVIYPKTCLHQTIKANHPVAWRIKTPDKSILFKDVIQGHIEQNLSKQIGDFVLKRADGQFAYQLAVVVDDAEQGITNVVRGADLLNSTTRQIYIQKLLGYTQPTYMHIPIVKNKLGQKLSKQTLAAPIDIGESSRTLWQALAFLNQNPPQSLKHKTIDQLWKWAIPNWQANIIHR